jgi:hypothetical protein
MSKNFKVALVAIAANEAAYMAQFVYHHLRMGFSPIILMTNNSEDDTAAMAAQMAARLPEVIHIDADPWREVWPINEFQKRAYQLALHMIDGMQVKPDYVMFLDIDEFWVPLTGDTTVSAYINRHEAPDSMMFNWVVPEKDDAPFSQAFVADFVGCLHDHLKMFWRYGGTVTVLNPHAVTAPEFKREVVVSGRPLKGRHATVGVPDHPGDAMILHQMFRSLPEYVASLGRGNPADDRPFKLNRWGFRHVIRTGKKVSVPLGPELCKAWEHDFPIWLERLGLSLLLIAGRRNAIERAARGLELYLSMTEADREPYRNPFLFVDFDAVQDFVSQALTDPVRHLHRIP